MTAQHFECRQRLLAPVATTYPLALDRVGERKGHAGRYRVTLRYERMEDAKAAAAKVQQVVARDGMYELVLDVPVVKRAEPDDLPPPEIRIDW